MANKNSKKSNSKPDRLGWIPVEDHKPTPLTKKQLKGVLVTKKELSDHIKKFGDQAILVP
jgi:hypothetical protein